MLQPPKDVETFTKLAPWWRTEVATEIVLSGDGVGKVLDLVQERGAKAFFVVDTALEGQEPFRRIFDQKEKFLFDASQSEPRTGDVDGLVEKIHRFHSDRTLLIGVGGGATMDLAKATAICLNNPLPAEAYQGYGLDMNRGADVWALPALNGTGAEITPIAVLRGPEKKLGINNAFVEPSLTVVDPQLSYGAPKFNRFYTMMDCYYHHYEISKSKTSCPKAIEDALDGLELSRQVLSQDLSQYRLDLAIASAMASVLGGSSTIGGRVGIPHAISYGLSNSAPKLPHSVAVTLAMLALEEIYPDGYADTLRFLEINAMARPSAKDYGIGEKDVTKMTKTALGMEKLWQSCFGLEAWKEKATPEYIEAIYRRIVA